MCIRDSAVAVEVSDLVKRYPKAPVDSVAGISFRVRPGEVFGFLGPNGGREDHHHWDPHHQDSPHRRSRPGGGYRRGGRPGGCPPCTGGGASTEQPRPFIVGAAEPASTRPIIVGHVEPASGCFAMASMPVKKP